MRSTGCPSARLSHRTPIRSGPCSRRLFAELERAQVEGRALDVDYKRLDVERQAQATNLRVEKVARERLAMRNATPAVMQYVTDAPSSAAGRATP
jgi:cell division protein FtsL